MSLRDARPRRDRSGSQAMAFRSLTATSSHRVKFNSWHVLTMCPTSPQSGTRLSRVGRRVLRGSQRGLEHKCFPGSTNNNNKKQAADSRRLSKTVRLCPRHHAVVLTGPLFHGPGRFSPGPRRCRLTSCWKVKRLHLVYRIRPGI